jgi:hypothetical protein
MRSRIAVANGLVVVLGILTMQPVRPQSAPTPKPTPPSVAGVVTDLIAAGRNAASDVYVVHQFGANLGLSPSDIAQFDISYVKLSASANGLLESMVFSLQTNTVDTAKIQSQADLVGQQGQALDLAVTQLQKRQQSTGSPTQFGLDLGSLLKGVTGALSPVLGIVTQVLDIASKNKASAQADRQNLATSIRAEFWPDVKVAGSAGWPTPAPAIVRPVPGPTGS